MARIVVATPEPIGRRIAGPAIRAAQIARVLDLDHDVTLISMRGDAISPIDGRQVLGPEALDHGDFDAAVVQGSVLIDAPELAESEVPIVVDWFDPFHLEALHRSADHRIRRLDLIEGARQTLLAQAARGDFFLCSNHAQREHWLGWLSAAGRVNHINHDRCASLDALIQVAPFGIADEKLDGSRPLRSTFSVIGPDDPIVLWAGGLHDWLDALTVVNAMPAVLDENPDTRLVFLAGPHPNTKLERMGLRGDAISAARDLKLFGTHVLFVTHWVDYDDRLNWFADATIGVVAHGDHVETRLSHRTRLVDHLAAGLPTVSTAGDPASSLLSQSGAAILVPIGDADAMGQALAGLLRDSQQHRTMSEAARNMAATMTWEATLSPLIEWMKDPQPAADRRPGAVTGEHGGAGVESRVERLVGRARMHWDNGGARQIASSLARRSREAWPPWPKRGPKAAENLGLRGPNGPRREDENG